jgi:hypothetical protein
MQEFQRVYHDYMLSGSYQEIRQAMEFQLPNRTISLPDPTFRATYVGVTVAGWRADVIKMDDCVERRNVTNPEMSMKIMTQMMDFFPLLDDTGVYQNLIGAGTRYAYHDPYGRILGENAEDTELDDSLVETLEDRKIKVMVRHALEDPERSCEACPPHIVGLYPHNHPTMAADGISCSAPIHEHASVMKDYKRYMQNPNLGESLFWHQLMNVCLAPSDQKYKPEWFLDLDKPTWPVVKKRVLAIDSADKEFQKEGLGDYMVALFGDFDDNGRLCIRFALHSNRWTRTRFIDRIITSCETMGWWPNVVVKEKFGEDTFLADMKNALLAKSRPTHVIPMHRSKKLAKIDWIVEQTQRPMESGEIIWGSQVKPEIRRKAEAEHINLGQSTFDDIADDLALLMSPGIRVPAVNRALPVGTNLTPPEMNLYNPAGASAPQMPSPDPSAMEQFKQGGTMILISPDLQGIGQSEFHYDSFPGPDSPAIGFDKNKGTGR